MRYTREVRGGRIGEFLASGSSSSSSCSTNPFKPLSIISHCDKSFAAYLSISPVDKDPHSMSFHLHMENAVLAKSLAAANINVSCSSNQARGPSGRWPAGAGVCVGSSLSECIPSTESR